MKIAITGSNGFIGTALTKHLTKQGHEVIPVTRKAIAEKHILWDPETGIPDIESFDNENIDAVVHLAGVGVAEKKWTDEQKKKINDSREIGTRTLVESLGRLKNKPKIFVSSSAIGYYGSRKDEVLTESSERGEGFLSDVCLAWEEQAQKAQDQHSMPTAIIRTGIVLDSSGGTLGKLLTPFKIGIGGKLGSGEQYMSWISLEDHIRATEFLLEKQKTGIYNLVAPNPVTNLEFTHDLGQRLSRPTILPTPLLPLKILYGTELVENVLLGSQRVLPEELLNAGFVFRHKKLPNALEDAI